MSKGLGLKAKNSLKKTILFIYPVNLLNKNKTLHTINASYMYQPSLKTLNIRLPSRHACSLGQHHFLRLHCYSMGWIKRPDQLVTHRRFQVGMGVQWMCRDEHTRCWCGANRSGAMNNKKKRFFLTMSFHTFFFNYHNIFVYWHFWGTQNTRVHTSSQGAKMILWKISAW